MELYGILDLERTCSAEQIKKSYYRLALKYHPDRCSEPEAKQRFQQVALAYEVLSNEERRKLYDATGMIEANGDSMSWKEYMDSAFPKITIDALEEFKENYIGSVEEYQDILAAYMSSKGSLEVVIDSVFWGDLSQADRYYKLITGAIDRKIVPLFKSFEPISDKRARKRNKREKSEALEAEEELAKMIKKDPKVKSLEDCIRGRQKENMNHLIDRLEQRYCNK